ncbi:MAG: hypothetical protein A2Y38_11350 [Spirochaetes bacterium GWB1_59_5]|nr:MAG: hypothetical protein A2Y38_11350 [Spirochaetes bacterium GWB1_59_5]
MTSLTVRMVREFPPEGIVHLDVDHFGDITVLGNKEIVPQRIALEILGTRDHFRARTGSQLATIRHLSLMGWRVAQPELWLEHK